MVYFWSLPMEAMLESILYVSWPTLGHGLLFSSHKRAIITVAAATFVTAMLLWTCTYRSWVRPSIANLVPVLVVNWLMIHVRKLFGSLWPT